MIFDKTQNQDVCSSAAPEGCADFIRRIADAPPVVVPTGYVGPIYMATGRLVWWTGRVAIGLQHRAPQRDEDAMTQSAEWLQQLVLGGKGRRARAAASA